MLQTSECVLLSRCAVVDVGCVVCELVSVKWKRRAAAAACTRRRRHRRQLLAWVDGSVGLRTHSASEAVCQSVSGQKKKAQQQHSTHNNNV